MHIDEWNLYVSDTGHVYCRQMGSTNEEECEDFIVATARRPTFGEIKAELVKHARDFHGIELDT